MVTNSSSSPSALQRQQSARSWLPRRMFHRTSSVGADIISTHTNDRQGDTEFFASLETCSTLAFFRREELQVGDLLGKGTFTEIHAVTGIDVDSVDGEDLASVKKNHVWKREELEDTLLSPNGTPQYAIKQLTAQTLQQSDAKTLARAARELVNNAKYLARLSQHANIVTLRGLTLDAFGHNYLAHQFEDFFVLLDRVAPYSLHDKIYREWRREAEPDEDLIPMKANYAFQLAKALRHCHQNGVLYRDLKPSNVGFSFNDPHCVQLMDFGLARDFQTGFRMTLAGTRRYLAGEVLARGEYSWKSDVYSWAMVFYEMCTERKPYNGLTAPDHQMYVCEHGSRPSLDDFYLPDALDNILNNSWHPYLNRRWSMDQVCAHMLSFLMQLDIGYYQQNEGDFLFDIEVVPEQVEESWLEDDEMMEWSVHSSTPSQAWWMEEQEAIREEGVAPTTITEESPPAEDQKMKVSLKSIESGGEDPEMKISLKSTESGCGITAGSNGTGGNVARRASIGSVQRKIISSAA